MRIGEMSKTLDGAHTDETRFAYTLLPRFWFRIYSFSHDFDLVMCTSFSVNPVIIVGYQSLMIFWGRGRHSNLSGENQNQYEFT